MNNVLEAKGLTKLYGTTQAVAGLDWQIPQGSACAFLGPNGSGKSTTLRMCLGMTPATRGTCQVLGEDAWAMRPQTRGRIGYVSEQPILPPWMLVGRLVQFHANFYPNWDSAREKKLRDLFEIRDKERISNLSKGQHRRLMLFLALCQGSDLLLLDEPASGLDVAARRQLLSLLSDFLAGDGKTLVVSTHIVTDIERIASDVAFIQAGRLLECASLDDLKEQVKRIRLPRDLVLRAEPILNRAGILDEETNGAQHVVTVREFSDDLGHALQQAVDNQADVLNLSLEDIYLAIVGNKEAVVQ